MTREGGSMAWVTSTRAGRLPADWPVLRRVPFIPELDRADR